MIINCTPHDINIYNTADCYMRDGCLYLRDDAEKFPKPFRTFPAAKEPARVTFAQDPAGMAEGIIFYRWYLDKTVNLPEQMPGTYYIVSKMVAKVYPERTDLIFPGTVVRNKSGDVVGCVDFSRA